MNIKEIAIEIKKLRAKVLSEGLDREAVKVSQSYIEFEKLISDLRKDQMDLFNGISDSQNELQEKEDELLQFMIQTDTFAKDGVQVTFTTKRSVNMDKAKELMGDDLLAYAKVSQKDLKEYSDQFRESDLKYATEVMKCVEVISKDPSGIKIS